MGVEELRVYEFIEKEDMKYDMKYIYEHPGRFVLGGSCLVMLLIPLIIVGSIFAKCMAEYEDDAVTMEEYAGVFYYKHGYERHDVLDYVILSKDSSYIHAHYGEGDSTIFHGKWCITPESGDNQRLSLFDWTYYDYEYNNEFTIKATDGPFDWSKNLIRFNPDTDIDYWRTDLNKISELKKHIKR